MRRPASPVMFLLFISFLKPQRDLSSFYMRITKTCVYSFYKRYFLCSFFGFFIASWYIIFIHFWFVLFLFFSFFLFLFCFRFVSYAHVNKCRLTVFFYFFSNKMMLAFNQFIFNVTDLREFTFFLCDQKKIFISAKLPRKFQINLCMLNITSELIWTSKFWS